MEPKRKESFQFHRPSIKYISKFPKINFQPIPVINLWIRITQILELISTKREDYSRLKILSLSLSLPTSTNLDHAQRRIQEESLALRGEAANRKSDGRGNKTRYFAGSRSISRDISGRDARFGQIARLAHGWINYPTGRGREGGCGRGVESRSLYWLNRR